MRNKLLFIDDSKLNREEVVKEMTENGLGGVLYLVPETVLECELKIDTEACSAAVIDFNLKEWVGDNNESPILFGETEIYDGIDLARYLLKENPKIQVAMFSANSNDLRKSIETSDLAGSSRLKVVRFAATADSFCGDFVEFFREHELLIDKMEHDCFPEPELIRLNMSVRPLFELPDRFPEAVELFFARKVLSFPGTGQYFWKAGQYVWQAAVNERLEALKSEEGLLAGEDEEYELWVNPDNYNLVGLANYRAGIKIHAAQLAPEGYPEPRLRLLYELFLVKFGCRNYLDGHWETEKLIFLLSKLSPTARFESQKFLFRYLAEEGSGRRIPEAFYDQGFGQILDIYEGELQHVHKEYAVAKMVSVTEPDVQRVEQLDLDLLADYFIEEDASFEYCVYRGPGPSNIGSQILPL